MYNFLVGFGFFVFLYLVYVFSKIGWLIFYLIFDEKICKKINNEWKRFAIGLLVIFSFGSLVWSIGFLINKI